MVDRFAAQHAEQLAGVPGAEKLRRQLLDDALGYYQEFIELVGDDPDLQTDLAITYFKAGAITEQIGDKYQALESYRKAKEVLLGLVRNQPEVDKHRAELALCHNNIGLVLSEAGDTQEARNAYQKAIASQRQLVEDHPTFPNYANDLATSYGNLGLLESQTNQVARAERSYRSALELQEVLVRAYPDEPQYARNLAISHGNLGSLCSNGDPAKAERCCRDAISLQEELVAAQRRWDESAPGRRETPLGARFGFRRDRGLARYMPGI